MALSDTGPVGPQQAAVAASVDSNGELWLNVTHAGIKYGWAKVVSSNDEGSELTTDYFS